MAGSTMKVWRVQVGKKEPIRTTIPIPEPGPDEVLVKVLAMGLCHSDCTIMQIEPGMKGLESWENEFTLGHEGAGEIVQLGSKVDATSYQIGDKVALYVNPGCNKPECPECSRGWQRICRGKYRGNHGIGHDGFFAEYVVVRADAAVKVPDGVKIEQAAISADAVLTSYHAVKYTAGVQPGQTIAIFGLGGLGFNGVQVAKHCGAKRIFVCDKRQEAVDAAVKLGVAPEDAFCTADPGAKTIQDAVAEKGIIVDTAIDFVGHEETMLSAQFTVRPGGTIVLVGLLGAQVPVIPVYAVSNALRIQGHYNGTVDGLRECLDLISQGVITSSIDTGSIEELPQKLKDLDDGKIRSRMVLLPDWK